MEIPERKESLSPKNDIKHSFLNDFMSLLWSIGSYIFDVTFDVALIHEYYQNGDLWYSGLTITFVAVPAIIIAILSSINYYERWVLVQQIKKTDDEYKFRKSLIVDSNGRFIFRFIFTILLMNPISRPIDVFYYGLQHRKALKKEGKSGERIKASCEENETNNKKMKSDLLKEAKKKEINQRIFFQLVESFTENAPQLLLQLYILAKKISILFYFNREIFLQTVSIFSSLFRLAFNLTVFQKITWKRSWILFPAHFFVIGSRVLILSFFAASANDSRNIWLFLLGHCLLMTLTLRITQKDDIDAVKEITLTRKFFLALSLVFAQVFAFLPFKSNLSTRFNHAFYYYAVCLVENTTLLVFWAITSENSTQPFRLYVIIGQPVLFFVGAFPLLYYLKCGEKLEGNDTHQPVHFGSAQLSISIKYGEILNRQLLKICTNVNADSVKLFDQLVEDNEVDVNCTDRMGRTPIILLCQFIANPNIYPCIKKLLRRKDIDVTVQDKDGNSALHTLCIGSYRYQTSIQVLMKAIIGHNGKKIDINVKNRNGWNALHILCFHSRDENLFDLIKLLIENGVEINTPNSKGSNVLHILCVHYKSENLFDIVGYLIDKGLKVKTEENGGWNPLLNLCRYYKGGNLKSIIEKLLDKDKDTVDGIDVNHKTSNGWNALHLLCRHYEGENLLEIINLLISRGIKVQEEAGEFVSFDENGKNIHENNEYKWNALHLLCGNNQVRNVREIIDLLVEKGIDENKEELKIDVHSKTSGEWNALHILCRNYEGEDLKDIIERLIELNIDIKEKTKDGCWTALQLLCRYYKGQNLKELTTLLLY